MITLYRVSPAVLVAYLNSEPSLEAENNTGTQHCKMSTAELKKGRDDRCRGPMLALL